MSSERSHTSANPVSRKRERAIIRLGRISAVQQIRQELFELGTEIDALEQSRREVEREVIAQSCLPGPFAGPFSGPFSEPSSGESSPPDSPSDFSPPEHQEGSPEEQRRASAWSTRLAGIENELVTQYELFDILVQLREREEIRFNQKLAELREN